MIVATIHGGLMRHRHNPGQATRPVVFADFDGCLAVSQEANESSFHLDPEKVAILARIISRTGAGIVVSSARRTVRSEMVRLFEEAGLPNADESVIGVTPQHFDGHRGREILMWLSDRQRGTAHIAIIDDVVDDLAIVRSRVVRTRSDVGLTEQHIPAIIDRLLR